MESLQKIDFPFLAVNAFIILEKKIKDKKHLAFWGTPPPPIGGMTVHIERLSKRLEIEGINHEMYNFTGRSHPNNKTILVTNLFFWYFKLLFCSSAKIHYVISTRTLVRFLAVLFSKLRNKKIILRVGGESLESSLSGSFFKRRMSIFAVRNCDVFIGVNKKICALATPYRKHKPTEHIPGFIPPVDNGETPPEVIQKFWTKRFPNIVVSGQIFEKDSFDIYGLWHALEAIKILKDKYPKITLVVFSYQASSKLEVATRSYKKHIKLNGLDGNVFVFDSKVSLWPSLKYCDIFLRPSFTDGDANSLREALFFSTTVVASDSVDRPEGTFLYPAYNISEMVSIINNAIESILKKEFLVLEQPDNAKKIIEIIKNL